MGYDYASTREIVTRLLLTLHLHTRGEEAQGQALRRQSPSLGC